MSKVEFNPVADVFGIRLLLLLLAIVSMEEISQLFIPSRSFSFDLSSLAKAMVEIRVIEIARIEIYLFTGTPHREIHITPQSAEALAVGWIDLLGNISSSVAPAFLYVFNGIFGDSIASSFSACRNAFRSSSVTSLS